MITKQERLDLEKDLLREVSREKLMEFTQNISKEVRLSGTQEELRAFKYVKEQLELFGLEPTLSSHDGYISLPEKASLTLGNEEFDCITHSMARSVSELQAKVVYTDKLIFEQESKYKDKVVVVDTGANANPGDVKWLTEMGAIGAIFINAGQYTHEMIVSPVWGNPTPQTADLLPRIPVVSVNYSTGDLIKKRLVEGIDSCVISTVVSTRYCPIPTLTAEIKGQEQPEKFVLLSGHIDSWHYGVMDNGTANATTLEVARVLAKYKDKLKRTVRIAFWSGHSHGRYTGSANYCDQHWEDFNENCLIHVNVDSTGAKGATDLTHGHCFAETKDLAKDVIKQITGQDFIGVRLGRAGDHSFWGTGTPSLFMSLSTQPPTNGNIGGLGWWWHTKEDTLDKIDPDNLERDTKIYALVVYRLLMSPIIPLNQLAAAEELEASLLNWQEIAEDHLDLSLIIEHAKSLRNGISLLQSRFKHIYLEEKGTVNFVNKSIMALSRILVPLLYVKGSNYDHDLAIAQPLVPKLAEIEKLVCLERGSNEYHINKTYLIRKCNEVNDLLKKANEKVERASKFLNLIEFYD